MTPQKRTLIFTKLQVDLLSFKSVLQKLFVLLALQKCHSKWAPRLFSHIWTKPSRRFSRFFPQDRSYGCYDCCLQVGDGLGAVATHLVFAGIPTDKKMRVVQLQWLRWPVRVTPSTGEHILGAPLEQSFCNTDFKLWRCLEHKLELMWLKFCVDLNTITEIICWRTQLLCHQSGHYNYWTWTPLIFSVGIPSSTRCVEATSRPSPTWKQQSQQPEDRY